MKRFGSDDEKLDDDFDVRTRVERLSGIVKKQKRSRKKRSKTTNKIASISRDKAPVRRLLKNAAAIRKAEANVHETLWLYLRDVYELAYEARRSKEVFKAICDDPASQVLEYDPDEKDRKNLIPLLIKSTLGGDRRTVQQKASDYKIALDELWRRKMKPSEVYEEIKENGGIENLKNAERKRRSARFAGTVSVPSSLDLEDRVVVGKFVKMYASVVATEDGQLILQPESVVCAKRPKGFRTVALAN